MAVSFILPLLPLVDRVLLPGETLSLPARSPLPAPTTGASSSPPNAVVASLVDGESVHEVAVIARMLRSTAGDVTLCGISRCRLLSLESEETLLVRAERLPDPIACKGRAERLAALLDLRYSRLQRALGRSQALSSPGRGLSALTWRITANIGFTAEQQQGILNVIDPLTRGKLLLVAVRELERRERFLRPFAGLRSSTPWN
jgi:hypothetical protein